MDIPNIQEVCFLAYLTLINIFSFMLFGIDKKRAEKKRWRIPESTLVASAILGGGVGSLMAMVIFKHKLSKAKFYIGVPCIIVITKIVELFIFYRLK